jgi:hypothetical protein
MKATTWILRFFAGLAGLVLLLIAAFALLVPWTHTWGATPEEVSRTLPGDELLDDPPVLWNHAVTIRAPTSEVWPWIAQLGDRRGGFYSYTFIENLIAGERMYVNANRIVPELQDPRPGTGLIEGFLAVRALEPGRWLLGDADPQLGVGWTWIWSLSEAGPESSRLHVRARIKPLGAMADAPAAIGFLIDVGGYVMERKMLSGIKLRAEGGVERALVQPLEIAVWLLALAIGIAAGVRYMQIHRWWEPLCVAAAAVLALVLFTFGQPPLWLRLLLAAALGLGLWRSWGRRTQAAASA